MRKKLTTVTLLLCVGIFSHAQNYNPSPIPCTKVTVGNMNNFNGTLNANCIVDDNNTSNNININGNQNVEFKAGEEINLDGEVWIHPNTNGNFYAHIESSEIGLAWYQPYDTPGSVLKFDKVEIGIDLPDAVNQKIQNYITNSGLLKLNPFNPEQIDVKAQFYLNTNANGNGTWQGPLTVFGFYYEEFIENTTEVDPLDWTLDAVTSEHKFRVRFAPPYAGLWRCKITITINQSIVYNANEFTFTVQNSASKGYMKVGSNNLYFQLGNETYFPIERNIPEPDLDLYGAPYSAQAVEDINTWDKRKIHPSYHKTFRDELSAYKNAGGDEFRIMLFADWYEIEFEKLNNYYDRLNTAWEFDRLVEHCSSIGLRMYLNMQNHEPFQWIGDQSRYWDWPAHNDITEDQSIPTCYTFDQSDVGYCYHNDAVYGVATPEEFLTDADSKKFYKYRLRYITSRWGYDPNINLFEIRSEMNNTAKYSYPIQIENPDYDPGDPSTGPQVSCGRTIPEFKYYTNEDNFLVKVSDWNHEMAEYLKTHQYFPHLLSVDYTGCPRLMYPKDANGDQFTYLAMLLGDESYYSPHIDVAGYNAYPGDIPIDRFGGDVYANLDLNHIDIPTSEQFATLKINKPIVIGERGYEPAQTCDNGIEYIKDLWIAAFTGNANAGNQWHYQHNYDLLQHHQLLKNFIYGINFSEILWTPTYSEREDKRGVMYCLKTDEAKKRATGIIENRTLNYYTNGCNNLFDSDTIKYGKFIPNQRNTDDNTTTYTNPQTFSYGSGANSIEIVGMGTWRKYVIDFFDALTGNYISTDVERSTLFGNLRLRHPDLAGYATGYPSNSSPLISFRVYRVGEPSFITERDSIYSADNLISLTEVSSEELPDIELTIWIDSSLYKTNNTELSVTPNPASSIIKVQYSGELTSAKLKIYNMQNSILYSSAFSQNSMEIDITNYSSGSYLLVIENNGKLYSNKFIKQ